MDILPLYEDYHDTIKGSAVRLLCPDRKGGFPNGRTDKKITGRMQHWM